jgi:hypothetical protein
MHHDADGIVKCHTPSGALWFPLQEIRAIREARQGNQNSAPPSTWLP